MPVSIIALLSALGALVGVTVIGGNSGGGSDDSATPSNDTDPVPADVPATPEEEEDDDAPEPSSSTTPVTIPATDPDAEPVDIGWEGLSAEEQMLVELMNRARLDPEGEAARQGVALDDDVTDGPKEVLAVTPELSQAAEDHSEDMDDRDYFAHTNPDGDSPADRALEAGHGSGYVGENLSWIGSTSMNYDTQTRIENHHDNLWASPGHQVNMLRDGWNEVGVGNDEGSYLGYDGSTFVTEKFSNRGEDYLTGVVIDDHDGDEFYDVGEGMGDVSVTAYKDGEAYETATWDAGGYTLALEPGTYTVVFSGGGLDEDYVTEVTMGGENVKLDVIETSDGVSLASTNGGDPEPGQSLALSEAPLLTDMLEDTGELAEEDAEEELEIFA